MILLSPNDLNRKKAICKVRVIELDSFLNGANIWVGTGAGTNPEAARGFQLHRPQTMPLPGQAPGVAGVFWQG